MGVSALAPLLVRHLASYAQLGAAAASEYRGACARRLLLLVFGVVGAVTGVEALWTAGMMALWDTPWRAMYAFGSAAVLLVAAIAMLMGAMSAGVPGPSTDALKGEVLKDLELFRQWKGSP